MVDCRTSIDHSVPAELVKPEVAGRLIREADAASVNVSTFQPAPGRLQWHRMADAGPRQTFDENGQEITR